MFQLLLIIIYLSFISLGLPDSLLGAAWPSMYGELTVSVAFAGFVSMIIAGCTIVSSLCSDRMIRKLGTGTVTAISVAMTAVALFGFSISHRFWQLCLWAIPYGLGAGSVDAALNHFVAVTYKARHMNWLHCFWGVGATLGPYLMGACLSGNLGWRFGYRGVSLLQVALTAAIVLSLPLWKRGKADSEQTAAAAPPVKTRRLFALPGAKQVLIAFFCYCSLEQVAGLWGSSYLVMHKGVTKELAASLISLLYLGITCGRFVSGWLTLKMSSRAMIRLGHGIALIGIAVLLASAGRLSMALGFILIGLGCAPIYPALLHQTPERFGKEASQSMMGMQMASAYAGSTASPFLAGWIVDRVGAASYSFLLLFFLILMGALIEAANASAALKNKAPFNTAPQ